MKSEREKRRLRILAPLYQLRPYLIVGLILVVVSALYGRGKRRYLVQRLRSTDSKVRWLAMRDVLRQRITSVSPEIITCLKDPHPEVRQMAFQAVTEFRLTEAVPALRQFLKPPIDPEGTYTLFGDELFLAAQALAAIGDPSVEPDLLEMIRDEDSTRAEIAAQTLGALRSSRAVEPLLRLLREWWDAQQGLATPTQELDEHVISAIVVALGRIGDERAIPALTALFRPLNEYDEEAAPPPEAVWIAATMGLAPFQDEATVDPLSRFLAMWWEMKQGAYSYEEVPVSDELAAKLIEALGSIGSTSAMPILSKVLRPTDQYPEDATRPAAAVWIETAKALARIGDDRALRPLVRFLGEEKNLERDLSPAVRKACYRAIEVLAKTRLGDERSRLIEWWQEYRLDYH